MGLWKFVVLAAAGVVVVVPAVAQQSFQTYRCQDGSEFVVAFYPGDKRAYVQLDGKARVLPKRIALSGARYSRGNVTLRIAKTGVTLGRGKAVTACTIKKETE